MIVVGSKLYVGLMDELQREGSWTKVMKYAGPKQASAGKEELGNHVTIWIC